MEAALCQLCYSNSVEIITLPNDNPDADINYLCSLCFQRADCPGSFSVPSSCVIAVGRRRERNLERLEERCHHLIRSMYEYQERVKREAEVVRMRYEEAFDLLSRKITEAQEKVLATINESEATEVEHVNAVIVDLRSVIDNGTLDKEVAYLAARFNREDEEVFPEFMTIPSSLEEYIAGALRFPEPEIRSSRREEHPDPAQSSNIMRQGTVRRLIEDNMLIMPIDTRNILVTDFSEAVIQRKMVPCRPHFPYRVHARWCRVNDDLYIYTGGLFRGRAVVWCDFINTSRVKDDQQIVASETGDMVLPRHRHALICYGSTVYVFGGHLDEPIDKRAGSGIECLQVENGMASDGRWMRKGDMEEEVSDLTATTIRNCIYLAGNSRAIYKYDTYTDQLVKVRISRILDMRLNPNLPSAHGPIETGRIDIPEYPLPRQSSNTLIFAWEAQIMLLQHDYLYYFTPESDQVDMSRKKLGVVKHWCSPFPVIVKESKCYFMLEPTENDFMPAGEVWTFDFIKKTVSSVDIKKKPR